MKLQWERPGVVRVTATVQEMAALVAGARMASRLMVDAPGERGAELVRVLAGFDRAGRGLRGSGETVGRERARIP